MPSSYGVYICDGDHRLAAAEEVHLDQQQARLDARHVERQHPGRLDVERTAAFDERVPHLDRARGRHPDLVAEIAGVAGARDVHRHAGDGAARDAEVLQPIDVRLRDRAQQLRGRRALQRHRRDLLRHVFDPDVHAARVLPEPAQARIRRRPAERLLRQPRHRPVVDHLAVLVAPRRVEHLADGHLRHVARDQPIDQARRVRSGDHVLEERRDVDQRRGVADGVVLVLVVALVGADGVVARPLAIVQALAERKGAVVEGRSDRHAAL